MNQFILFINILSIYFILDGILSFIYPKILNKTSLRNKGRKFILTRLFGTSTINTWRLFYLSALWLIVYYFDFIKEIIKGFLNG